MPASSPTPSPDSPETWQSDYPPEAFDFVSDGLGHTVSLVHGAGPVDEEDGSHVDGRQLSEGLRDFAIRRFGLLAPTVLAQWNIHRTDDFGRIVFAMIAMKRMNKTEEDRLEDFQGVYEFRTAFSDTAIVEAINALRDEERGA